jgi:hypothetical protein
VTLIDPYFAGLGKTMTVLLSIANFGSAQCSAAKQLNQNIEGRVDSLLQLFFIPGILGEHLGHPEDK